MLRQLATVMFFVVLATCVLRKKKPCINGSPEGDKCFCVDGWTGALCHRRMNCSGYERLSNGSCVECSTGWHGPDCDVIDCNGHGNPNHDLTECRCTLPFTGRYCDVQETKDIYLWYNNYTSSIGPVGIFTIVPLALIYFFCDRCAKKRQLRRVEDHLNGMQGDLKVDTEALKGLLEEKIVEEIVEAEVEKDKEKDKETEALLP